MDSSREAVARPNDQRDKIAFPAEKRAECGEFLVVEMSHRLTEADMRREAEISGLVKYVMEQDEIIQELTENNNEVTLDCLGMDEKIAEEEETFESTLNAARENQDMIMMIERNIAIGVDALKGFENLRKTAENLTDVKKVLVSANQKKFTELKALRKLLKTKIAVCNDKLEVTRMTQMQDIAEITTAYQECVASAENGLQELIDSNLLDGVNFSAANSVALKLQIALNFVIEKNKKLEEINEAQIAKRETCNEKISELEEKISQLAVENERLEQDIAQMLKDEETELAEKMRMETELLERSVKLECVRKEIGENAAKIEECDEAISRNEFFMKNVATKMEEETNVFESAKRNLESDLGEIRRQDMQQNLELLLTEGRLQELVNQLKNIREEINMQKEEEEQLRCELSQLEANLVELEKEEVACVREEPNSSQYKGGSSPEVIEIVEIKKEPQPLNKEINNRMNLWDDLNRSQPLKIKNNDVIVEQENFGKSMSQKMSSNTKKENKPGRPLKSAKASVFDKNWEEMVKSCAAVEKTVDFCGPPKRKFFKSSRVHSSTVTSTTGQLSQSARVFEYDPNDNK